MKIGFIGAGNLARAMACGILARQICRANEIACVSGSGRTASSLAKDLGIVIASSRAELIAEADPIILAFKPQHLETVTAKESEAAAGALIVSVLAGRSLADLRKVFPLARNIARAMPNTPSRIGLGVSAYCFVDTPTDDDAERLQALLVALGKTYEVAESQLHAVTAVSGCGPAVFFHCIDLVAEAAQQHGLPKELAIELAAETGIGSLSLLRQVEQTPQELTQEVVSPNGVTHALLESLEASGLSETIQAAVARAVRRSRELAGDC